MSTDCIFCKIIQGEIPANKVYEDDEIIAFDDIHPKADVHLLIVPKIHMTNLNDITPDNTALMGHLLAAVPKIAKLKGLTDYRVVINNGANGGQVVFHLHLHLLGGKRLPNF